MLSRIFITLTTIVLLSACKSTPNLTEDEVYTILNEIIADDSLYFNRLCWKFDSITSMTDEFNKDIKKEFSERDFQFIERKKKLFKNTTIKPNRLKCFNRRDKAFVNIDIDSACDKGILYHLSFPYISSDRQKV